jgi:hypothetical protein
MRQILEGIENKKLYNALGVKGAKVIQLFYQ